MPARKTCLALTLWLCAVLAFAQTAPFTPDAYMRHVKYLSGDEMQGRGNGTPELNKAAEYIAERFAAAGVPPAGDGGTFFQKFQVATGSRLGPRNILTFATGGQQVTAALGRDYVPFGVGDKTDVSGELVFAGYG